MKTGDEVESRCLLHVEKHVDDETRCNAWTPPLEQPSFTVGDVVPQCGHSRDVYVYKATWETVAPGVWRGAQGR